LIGKRKKDQMGGIWHTDRCRLPHKPDTEEIWGFINKNNTTDLSIHRREYHVKQILFALLTNRFECQHHVHISCILPISTMHSPRKTILGANLNYCLATLIRTEIWNACTWNCINYTISRKTLFCCLCLVARSFCLAEVTGEGKIWIECLHLRPNEC
jgi:hypothetical protein